jgi:aminocarboxymuconate-semialdehyde decarboxylase
MLLIDVHNHFYPPEYLDALKRGDSEVKLTIDSEGNPCIHYPGDYNVAVQGHRDIEYRQGVLEKEGVDTQIITFTTPGTHVETPERAIRFATLVNDAFAKIRKERAGRFHSLATLPLNDVPGSVAELSRAMTKLGMPGAMVFSNVNGVALADPRYEPLWAEANKLGAIIHIHPTDPVGVEAMTDYWLMPLVGFLADTTLAAAKLVFAGVPERYPNIKWVLGHLGGAIPYLAERLDRGFEAFPDCRVDIKRKPTEYLRQFYYDTVNFDPKAVRLCVDFAGADHVMAASDYPHQIGSIPKMKSSLAALDVSEAERKKIMGENARALYKL